MTTEFITQAQAAAVARRTKVVPVIIGAASAEHFKYLLDFANAAIQHYKDSHLVLVMHHDDPSLPLVPDGTHVILQRNISFTARTTKIEEWTGNTDVDAALVMLDRLDVSHDDDARVDAVSATLRNLATLLQSTPVSNGDVENLVTLDKRDLFAYVRAAIKNVLSIDETTSQGWQWEESTNRTLECLRELYAAELHHEQFQQRVQPWLMECFGAMIAGDREERNHRFLEESLELVQACGCTASEAHQLVDYVFGRPVGEKRQETGGVMVTLAALCLANEMDMHACGETELARIWTKVEQIRAKQAAKPKHSPLPVESASPVELADAAFDAAVSWCESNGIPLEPKQLGSLVNYLAIALVGK